MRRDNDEDITTSDTTIPSIELQGPIPRSRAQQLRRQVNSFLCSSANDLENRLVPNDLIVISNQGVDHGEHAGHQEGAREPKNMHNMVEVQANSESKSLTSSPTRSPGPSCLEVHIEDTSGLRFGGSTYAWKEKEITFSMPPVSWSTKIGVGRNCGNKTYFQNLPSAAPAILG
jgi:hypothetical protein